MRVLFIVALVSLILQSPAVAQNDQPSPTPVPAPASTSGASTANTSVGFKIMAGAGIPSYTGLPLGATAESAGAWSAGVFWNWSTGGAIAFAIQPELSYIYEAGILATKTNSVSITSSTNSIRLPILFKLELLDRAIIQPSIYAGPSFSYLLSAKNETSGATADLTGLNRFQVGLAVGVDVTFLEIFVVDLRYNTKFTTITDNLNETTSDLSVKLSSFRAGVGLRF